MDIEEIGREIVDSVIKVHRELGPGLFESAYQPCLCYELSKRGLQVSCEVSMPVLYDNQKIDAGYRVDMLVENCVIIENKSVNAINEIHEAQLLTYMKLGHFWLGYLINWNTFRVKNGIKRMVNGEKPVNC